MVCRALPLPHPPILGRGGQGGAGLQKKNEPTIFQHNLNASATNDRWGGPGP